MQPTHIANPVSINAATILDVTEQPSGNLMLRLSDGRNYTADTSMTVRYCPVVGDYLVTQDDGYEYLNPEDVFERKYRAIDSMHPVEQIAAAGGGTITSAGALPDGSGFATLSFPLPKGHWLTQPGYDVPPMPFRKGTDDPERQDWAEKIQAAARYEVRGATMNGTEEDFDPDAMVQNMVVGVLGYFTPDGLSRDPEANPDQVASVVQSVSGSDTSGLSG